MTAEERAKEAFVLWYENLPKFSGFTIKGGIAGGLAVLDRLRHDFDLRIESHTAAGGTQIRGAGGAAIKRILESFGEGRPFVKEGGRTNRGLRGHIKAMLDALASAGLAQLPARRRDAVLVDLQQFLVQRVQEFHGLQRLEIVYDPAKSTWQSIHDLLLKAAETGKDGPVAV